MIPIWEENCKMKYIIYLYLFSVALLLPTACSNEEEIGRATDRTTATVTLSIGTGSNDDGLTLEGERMHTLDVFLCTTTEEIVKEFHANGLGDATNWQSDPFTLDAGTYRLYAFANCEKITELESVISELSGQMPVDISSNQLSVEINGDILQGINDSKIIPMTGCSGDLQVTPSTKTLSVEVVRMVSRAKVRVFPSTSGESSVSQLKIGNVVTKVSLFKGGDVSDSGEPQTITVSSFNEMDGGSSEEKHFLSEFYLPELKNRNCSFELILNGGSSSSLRKANTTMTFDRNQIVPIYICLKNYQLVIKGTYQVVAIGTLPIEGQIDLAGNYEIKLPEGCTFNLTVSMKSTSGSGVSVSSWDLVTEEEAISLKSGAPNGENSCILSGSLSAYPGQNLNLTLNATVADNGTETFNITIKTVGLETITKKNISIEDGFSLMALPQVVGMY